MCFMATLFATAGCAFEHAREPLALQDGAVISTFGAPQRITIPATSYVEVFNAGDRTEFDLPRNTYVEVYDICDPRVASHKDFSTIRSLNANGARSFCAIHNERAPK